LVLVIGAGGKRIAVAMSGGVDSSVAAALLVGRGCDVMGLTMRLWREPRSRAADADGISSARQVCQHLGIPHQVVDLRREFLREVVDPFVGEYARGRTPNPCLRCNRLLKFGLLRDHARRLGCDSLATGHYARIEWVGGAHRLLSGVDSAKDQSYMLYGLREAELASLVFPLGGYTKSQVRGIARQTDLPAAQRPESQDVCFLGDNDYRRFLAERLPGAIRPGPILDLEGRQLGEHRGLPLYTVGQRQGLGISAPRPLYVKRLDVEHNALVVAFAKDLGTNALIAEEMSYVSGRELPAASLVEAKIRYRAPAAPARVWPLAGDRVRVLFEHPLRDITPGQAVVLYRGQWLLGGGIIAQAIEDERPCS